jgi:uncharacterized membrane protein YphA (DoxX/SURF4 family)
MSKTITNPETNAFTKFLNFISKRLNSIAGSQEIYPEWKEWEKILFRFLFIFLILLSVPLDWKFFRDLFSIDWIHLHFHDLFRLTKYQIQFISQNKLPLYGIGSFANWGIAILISVLGCFIWSKFDLDKKEYNVLYYWLRVIVRFRLAVILITYGFIKFFPLQMPYPSLSNLLTNYGDFFAWKIYFQTVGITPKYEAFLGFVEILAAFLLFNRKTTTIGVGLIFGFIGNVAVVNGLYDMGELLNSSFIVLLATFLFAYDIPRLYYLLIKEVPTYANKLVPNFSDDFLKKTRLALKSAFLIFVLLFGFIAYQNYTKDPYKVPRNPGLDKAFGYYNVKDFILNNDTIPYSKTDPNRWQDVVFEKWSTISIKVNRPVKVDYSSGELASAKDIDRNYELVGLSGRHYFYYEIDSVNHTLSLQNKNKNHRSEKLLLTYERPTDSTIVLSGTNENKQSIRVVLNKINKKYMMLEGRRKEVKL